MLREVIQIAKNVKAALANGSRPLSLREQPLAEQFPWSSPNVWQRVVGFYTQLHRPAIFEFGSGVSSIWHVRNLLGLGGSYDSVEHEPDWYNEVVQGIVGLIIAERLDYQIESNVLLPISDHSAKASNTKITFVNSNSVECSVHLMLRPAVNRTDPNDGSPREFQEYVEAACRPYDIIFVDGRARIACVNHVLDGDLLRKGGLLALFEAGRGVEGWLELPRLEGTSDYQPVVQRMISLGADLVDGSGLASWPNCRGRRTKAVNAYHYPLEACLLVK